MKIRFLSAMVLLVTSCGMKQENYKGGDGLTPYSSDDSAPIDGEEGQEPILKEFAFTDSKGRKSLYKINIPRDYKSKKYGLHVHLHGDGGRGYRDFPNREPRYDLIGVTVKSPSEELKWGRDLQSQDGVFLQDLIQDHLIPIFNIDKKKIYFSTVSGGSHFMTGIFIPQYGHHYKSKAFVMCGGIAPLAPPKDPSVLRDFRIHWQTTTGEREDIAAKIELSKEAYARLALEQGLSPERLERLQSSRVTGPGAHCYFDDKGYSSGIQQAMDQDFKDAMGL